MQVQTVLGPILPSALGRTLTHEHFSMDFDVFYTEPPSHLNEFLAKDEIRLETVGFLRQYPYGSHYNLCFNDEKAHTTVLDDVQLYRKWGGGSIVENSSIGLKRNLPFLCDVSTRTGVNIIAGTGHYVHNCQEPSELNLTVEEMVELYHKEIQTGVDLGNGQPFVKCGFIGEVGSVWPIHDFEKRAIQATGIAQESIGCPVSFHPGRDSKAPFEIIRLYLEAGGRADKCIMSHLDRTLLDIENLLEFANTGVYCQFDLFGTECSFYQLKPTFDMPSDADRINKIIQLVENGFVERITMSHDVHTKHRLIGFGGHGFGHIINNIIPRLTIKGLSDEQINQIVVRNPAEWLQFNL